MSPLPPADTSSQQTRPGAPADSPTERTDRVKPQGRGSAARESRGSAKRRTPTAPAMTLDQAMGTAMKPISTRGAEELLGLLRERAQQVEAALPPELRAGGPGGTLRLVITDALVHALDLEPEAHAQRVEATRRRELLAQARAKVGG